MQIKVIGMGFLLYILRGHRSAFPIYDVFLSLRIVFHLNSVDPDKMYIQETT